MDAAKLARLLREEAEAIIRSGHKHTGYAFSTLAGIIERAAEPEPAPAEYWHGPFPWAGGEKCPLPPDVMIGLDSAPPPQGGWQARHIAWRTVRGLFYYRSGNPEGWVPRPAGWVPPEGAWPLEWLMKGDPCSLKLRDDAWDRDDAVTHIRLLPRSRTVECRESPDMAKVRDALRAVHEHWRGVYGEPPVSGPIGRAWHQVQAARRELGDE